MDDPLNEPTTGDLLHWHERPCGWCGGWGLYVVTLDDDMTPCEECRTVDGAARPIPAALPAPLA